ncbi:MAG: 8-oxo-dGTP pyrophosphatase MutT (NUDIX family) [Candidatus Poriferisodalaceae bacterium]|jgi:8-oxo-dGTP pyrophosphatase MutT (NUDIX family)
MLAIVDTPRLGGVRVQVGPGDGGAQKIPRPVEWAPGASAPWAHLAGVDRRIDFDVLAGRLQERVPGEQRTGAPPPRRDSAVLIPLVQSDGGLAVVLTRRTGRMRSHAGEVSFPGGAQDPGESLWTTAVREAEEEIALPRRMVSAVGELDRLVTLSSRARIHPYVGYIGELPPLVPNPAEVDRILLVDLFDLVAEGVYREELWHLPTFDGPRSIAFFELDGDTVWGATAAMLRQLLCIGLDLDAGPSYY